MSINSQKIIVLNPDGTTGQIAVNAAEGSLKVADTGLNWKPSQLASNEVAPYTTTASYASAIGGPIVIARPYSTITVNVKENNVNAVLYQIIGYTSPNFTKPIVLATALPVAKNGSDYQVVTMGLIAIDVQAVDAVGGTHGSLIVDVVAS